MGDVSECVGDAQEFLTTSTQCLVHCLRVGFPNKSVLFMMAVIGAASVSVQICQQRKLPSPHHSWVLLLDKSGVESHFDVGFLFCWHAS